MLKDPFCSILCTLYTDFKFCVQLFLLQNLIQDMFLFLNSEAR